jgi:hypothetical protein
MADIFHQTYPPKLNPFVSVDNLLSLLQPNRQILLFGDFADLEPFNGGTNLGAEVN